MIPTVHVYTSTTSSVAPYSEIVYIIQIIPTSIVMLASAANVTLHLLIKELQTVSGALISSLCGCLILLAAATLVYLLIDRGAGGIPLYFCHYIQCTSFMLPQSWVHSYNLCTLCINLKELQTHSVNSSNQKSILYKCAAFFLYYLFFCSVS